MSEPVVVLASHNAKKVVELRRVLDEAGVGVRIVGLDEVRSYPEPVEDGRTFASNAVEKARACAAATRLPALADDSGLCVEELNGMPGVRSARWAGPAKDDVANYELVLAQLDDVADDRRAAAFTCAVALVLPDARFFIAEGDMLGRLTREPRGDQGFGYDPIFVPDDGDGRTTAEMDAAEKDALSHRGKALRKMAEKLAELAESGDLNA